MSEQVITESPGAATSWPELLTPAEAARLLDADVCAVLSAVETGWISALRLGPYVRIPRRELAATPC